MNIYLSDNITMISDNDAPEVPEMPIIIQNYSDGQGISIIGQDGESVYFSYRQVKEMCKQLTVYATSVKSKKKLK